MKRDTGRGTAKPIPPPRVKSYLRRRVPAFSVGGGTTHRERVFQKSNLRLSHHSALLHRLLQVVRAGEPAGPLQAVPVHDQGQIAWVFDRYEKAVSQFPPSLPHAQVRVERFFPPAVIRHFVPNNDMDHDAPSR